MRLRRLSLSFDPQLPPQPGELVTLDERESRHGLMALRLKEGESIILSGPTGLAPACVERALKNPRAQIQARLSGPFSASGDDGRPHILLALSRIRPSRFDWAVEKASELGASRLIPILSRRYRGAEGQASLARLPRWQRLAEEARKQCGRDKPLSVDFPVKLEDFLESRKEENGHSPDRASLFMLDPDGEPFPMRPLHNPTLLIGPEGGFSPEEKEAALLAGFRKISLGPLILRSETAALASLSLLAQWPS
jgi:16S rRNA (uracil1498-N3)-methyltransferase